MDILGKNNGGEKLIDFFFFLFLSHGEVECWWKTTEAILKMIIMTKEIGDAMWATWN